MVPSKEVQIVYRLFLVNCYLLHVARLPSQPASTEKDLRGWVIEKNWLELAWQYIAVTRNNLYIIWIALTILPDDCSWRLKIVFTMSFVRTINNKTSWDSSAFSKSKTLYCHTTSEVKRFYLARNAHVGLCVKVLRCPRFWQITIKS